MSGQLTPKTLFATLLINSGMVAAASETCSNLFDEAMASDLTLSYEEFDQTRGSGFRSLSENGCPKEAADLIEAYIAATDAPQHSLVWHIAQLRAAHGDYDRALTSARASLNPSEDWSEHPLRWNDYVHGVIAFLESDLEKLVLHRNRVAEGVDTYFGNELNRNVLDSLIKHFGRTYSYASSQIGK